MGLEGAMPIAREMGKVVDNATEVVKQKANELKSNASDISAGDILVKSIEIDAAKDAATLAGNIAKSASGIQSKTIQQAVS